MRFFVLIIFLPLLFSCGRECDKQNSILEDTINLQNLRPQGVYYVDGIKNSNKNITFNSDSTAVYKYKNGDSTYEIRYKVKVKRKIEYSQVKFQQQ